MKGVRIITKLPTQETKRTSTRMTADMVVRISEGMHKGGYSTRQRSKWISESLERLGEELKKENKEDRDYFIKMAQPVTLTGNITPISLSVNAAAVLDQWVKYLQDYALDESDAQTRLIHLGISIRLMKDGIGLI
jgi:hypothetical protein